MVKYLSKRYADFTYLVRSKNLSFQALLKGSA